MKTLFAGLIIIFALPQIVFAAYPTANWPYQPTQALRPQAVMVTNTYTATAFDTSAGGVTQDTIDLGDSYNRLIVTADTDCVVSLTYGANAANGDYVPAGGKIEYPFQARYLWVVTRSGITATFPVAIRVRGIR